MATLEREDLPIEGTAAVPWWIAPLGVALLAWAAGYVWTYSAAFRSDVHDDAAPGRRTAVQATLPLDAGVLGRRVYARCAGCHQPDGTGVPGLYPPLTGTAWVTGDPVVPTRIALHGLGGPVEIDGVEYDQPMPAWRSLRDDQLAAVLTYIRTSWGNAAASVTPDRVARVRSAAGDRRLAWSAVELTTRKADEDSAPP